MELADGKKRWVQVVTELSRAFTLCAASDEATDSRDDVSFFQALQAALNKQSSSNRKTPEQIDAATKRGEDMGLLTPRNGPWSEDSSAKDLVGRTGGDHPLGPEPDE